MIIYLLILGVSKYQDMTYAYLYKDSETLFSTNGYKHSFERKMKAWVSPFSICQYESASAFATYIKFYLLCTYVYFDYHS